MIPTVTVSCNLLSIALTDLLLFHIILGSTKLYCFLRFPLFFFRSTLALVNYTNISVYSHIHWNV